MSSLFLISSPWHPLPFFSSSDPRFSSKFYKKSIRVVSVSTPTRGSYGVETPPLPNPNSKPQTRLIPLPNYYSTLCNCLWFPYNPCRLARKLGRVLQVKERIYGSLFLYSIWRNQLVLFLTFYSLLGVRRWCLGRVHSGFRILGS